MSAFALNNKKEFYLSLLLQRLQDIEAHEAYTLINFSEIEIQESVNYDTWNDGQDIHAVNLRVPKDTFLLNIDDHPKISELIRTEFNKIYRYSGEHIGAVNILPDENLITTPNTQTIFHYANNKLPSISSYDKERIWGAGALRIFISHRDSDKLEAKNIQTQLEEFNIASFVAHEDIKVTEEWAKEILRALMTMDIFLCLITDDFFDSKWTNQEVGFALGKNIPVLPFKTNLNTPDGFISILQAGKYNKDSCAHDIIGLLTETKSIPSTVKDSIIESIIQSFHGVNSWSEAEKIAELFQYIEKITDAQAQQFIDIFNNNGQINCCYSLSGYDTHGNRRNSSRLYAEFLNRCTDKEYIIEKQGNKIRLMEKPQKSIEIDRVPF